MKSQTIVGLTSAIIFGCRIAAFSAPPPSGTFRAELKSVPVAEVPARAAVWVAAAPFAKRDGVTTEVVRLAVKAHPTIAPAIVGSIAKQCPSTAPAAAGTAARLQPKQIRSIAQAAAAAAPAEAGRIVQALCTAVPTAYREVALIVARVCPAATEEILAGVSTALPTLKAGLDSAIASYAGQLFSVAAVLDRISPPAPDLNNSVVRGPTIGAPFIPLSSTPTNTPPGGGEVPPGGRDYARP